MNKEFEMPEIQIINLDSTDIIVTSNCGCAREVPPMQ